MRVLVLFDYPAGPGGLATQGDLLFKGLQELGVDVHAVHYESNQEKEWYYRWFKPDVVTGVGYWGYVPHLVLHAQQFGVTAVPWLVADGYIANYQEVLNTLPLILVTSNWVKEMYVRDGISGRNIEVLPVGCDTDRFRPFAADDPKVAAVRNALGIHPDELMILTVGGDAASKGAQEVMHALARLNGRMPQWKYVCKVWPQERTDSQNQADFQLAHQLGISDHVIYTKYKISRNFMPYLLSACDIYAAPSRLEGFGMTQVEANACGKPVVSLRAMGMLDTMVHGETALLASIADEIVLKEVVVGAESGFDGRRTVVFDTPRTVDYRASSEDIAAHLGELMVNEDLRLQLGAAGRSRVMQHFDYRVVAKRFLKIVEEKLGII
ncbi:glycosyltransferase family 4 protein [Chitinophaga flava]|uniref:Glycosyl transferase family 1 n=1 Tax=Chitinophaga flava TaxID=2259036 RepID=A0A365XSC4_9BACT|nr:glycosyltransferase family 4 protein [Chitinophaga flava]RBL88921.1 glycosyl transferase family 1 [Chitinophaga flava]